MITGASRIAAKKSLPSEYDAGQFAFLTISLKHANGLIG
jgi:predicted ferric reductase